jgi:hypothetical protein
MRVALIVLIVVASHASADSHTVRVPAVLVRLVPNMDDMPKTCATNRDVKACTAFAGQQLTCSCALDGDEWRMSARAQYIPVLYVSNSTYRSHEELHIRDVDAALRNYLDELANRRFATAADCDVAARTASGSFEAVMDQFKIESNMLRHPR